MKILCINQFFWPDLAPTSQLLADVVRRLASDGHRVTVICGSSLYAHEEQAHPMPKEVKVRRVPGIGFSSSRFERMLSYVYFICAAILNGLLAEKPDVVLTMTTPPLISLVGTLVKLIKGSRHFIWEMDLYPEVAIDLGVMRPASPLAKIFGHIADAQRRQADGIISLGECMRNRLIARGLKPEKIQIAHNWADGDVFFPLPAHRPAPLCCIYPGNLGLGHDIDTLLGALRLIHSDARIRFCFVGGGARYRELKAHCEILHYENVVFKPYCVPSELAGGEFSASNVGLVLQDPRCLGSIVPSKVYSLLAAGLPILYVGPRTATPAQIIDRFQCGWHIEPGDSAGLIALLTHLAGKPEATRAASGNARRAFLENYDRSIGTSRIIGILGCTGQQSAAAA